MKNIEVVAAVIINDNNEVFCARRIDSGELASKWEFPGGKIELGESKSEALIREIREELSIDIEINEFLMTVQHQYITFHLTMYTYLVKVIKGDFILNEHTAFQWLNKDHLLELDWAASDIPVVNALILRL